MGSGLTGWYSGRNDGNKLRLFYHAGVDKPAGQPGGAAQVDMNIGRPDAADAETLGAIILVHHPVKGLVWGGLLLQHRPVKLVAADSLAGL